jgi:hypothetical protein
MQNDAVQQPNDANKSTPADQTPPSVQPPPLANWYYVQNGSQRGPVTADELKALLRNKTIDPETQVWRAGLGAWQSVRTSELADTVENIPPPISPTLVRNGLVWTAALLPLVFGFIDASIAYENQLALARTFSLGAPLKKAIPEIPVGIPASTTLLLCLWDFLRLRKVGYDLRKIIWTAIILPPVYLFMRAKRVKQRPTYAITWIVTTIVYMLLMAAVTP